jgi:hypothetical protein
MPRAREPTVSGIAVPSKKERLLSDHTGTVVYLEDKGLLFLDTFQKVKIIDKKVAAHTF